MSLSNLQLLSRAVCAGARVQVARVAEAVRQPAHGLHAHEPLVKGGRVRPHFEKLQTEQIVRIKAFAGFHLGQGAPGRHRRAQKNGPQSIGKSRRGWNTEIHLVAADARTAVAFSLSPREAHDAPEGRDLLRALGPMPGSLPLLMYRAYEGDETRRLLLALSMIPVVPPKRNRLDA